MDSARRDLGRKAHDMADHLDKMKNAIIAVVVLLVLSAVPLAALIVGSIGLNQCPIQPMVPIWLLVVGVVGIAGFSCLIVEVRIILDVHVALNFYEYYHCKLFCKACCFYEKWKKDQNRPFIYSVGITVLLISLFYCGWLIAVSESNTKLFNLVIVIFRLSRVVSGYLVFDQLCSSVIPHLLTIAINQLIISPSDFASLNFLLLVHSYVLSLVVSYVIKFLDKTFF